VESIRREIDEIDGRIIRLIAQRQQLAARLAHLKYQQGIPIHDPEQESRVLARAFDRAVEAKVNPVPVQQIFHTLMEMSQERQRECQGDGNLP
jgi:chorismate mutase